MLKRNFLLTCVIALMALPPAFAQTPSNCMIGVGAGADNRWHFDVAFASTRWGATAKGLHVGGIGSRDKDDSASSPYTQKAPGHYEDVTSCSGLQIGAFADWGRAWAAIGAETLTRKVKAYTVDVDHTWHTASGAEETGGQGAYLKVGWRLGSWSIYAGYGTRSKAQAGLAIHF